MGRVDKMTIIVRWSLTHQAPAGPVFGCSVHSGIIQGVRRSLLDLGTFVDKRTVCFMLNDYRVSQKRGNKKTGP